MSDALRFVSVCASLRERDLVFLELLDVPDVVTVAVVDAASVTETLNEVRWDRERF